MSTFQLFRAQVHGRGVSFPRLPFEPESPLRPEEALTAAITEAPSGELRRGHTWHLGNVRQLDGEGWYFALGRTTRSAVQLFDEQTKQFADTQFETAPYTHVVLDTGLGLCAIAPKPRLATSTEGIARRLEQLLDNTDVAMTKNFSFDIAPIADPEGFVRRLKQAHSIKKFTFNYGLPNAWDVERHIIKPAQQAARDLRAHGGSSTFSGQSLDKERLEELARSTAATGHDASAKIQDDADTKAINIRLSREAVLFRTNEAESESLALEALHTLRNRYKSIRSLFSPDTRS